MYDTGFIFTMVFCGLYLVLFIVALILFIGWVAMLIDALTRKEDQFGTTIKNDARVVWLIIIFFTNWVGAFIYYIMVVRKNPRN